MKLRILIITCFLLAPLLSLKCRTRNSCQQRHNILLQQRTKADFKSQCQSELKTIFSISNYQKDPRAIVTQMATDGVFLSSPAFKNLSRAKNPIMTLRALILARYFGIAIEKKQVHEFYKSDIPDSCNQGFGANVCQSIIDLKHAFLKSQNFYYKCVQTLKRSQALEISSLLPFNIFTYSDMCNGITHIMVQLQRLEKINDDDKVCDVVYSYMQDRVKFRLELYRRDSDLYLQKFCSNQPFKGQSDFMKVCQAGFKDTHSLFWLTNHFEKLCSLAQGNVMKRCGSNKACDFCTVIRDTTSDEIISEWKNMTSTIYTKQIKIEQYQASSSQTSQNTLAEERLVDQKYKIINRAKLIKSRKIAEEAVSAVIQETKKKDKENENRKLQELRQKEAREAAKRAMGTNT